MRHQRFPEPPPDLTTQHMEVIGCRGQVADLQIVLAAQLQVTLQPGRGMLRPLALIAVRQQADQPGHAQPLAFAG